MLDGLRIAVVIPAFNEERLIAGTIRSMPTFVDDVFVVDDASNDGTVREAAGVHDNRVRIVRHPRNRGVGAAIVTGYRAGLAAKAQVLAVMAGDGQMDPEDLPALLAPVCRGTADYAKGDRMSHPEVRRRMPAARRIVGGFLTKLTRCASGLATLSDSQCGYTAIAARALQWIDLDALWPRYGYPNDVIGRLALAGARIVDVPVCPVYGSETSRLRPWHVLGILWILAATACRRHSAPATGQRLFSEPDSNEPAVENTAGRSRGRPLSAKAVR